MNYINDNNRFKFEKASETIRDMTDGYLSNIEKINYQGGSNIGSGGLFSELSDEEKEDHIIGSRLLSTLSQIHSILIDHTISDQDIERNLERLTKFSSVASKLSDKYAKEDSLYAQNFHQDVIDICQAIENSYERVSSS